MATIIAAGFETYVQSQAAPNNRALCENLATIYSNMTIDLTIVSSYALP